MSDNPAMPQSLNLLFRTVMVDMCSLIAMMRQLRDSGVTPPMLFEELGRRMAEEPDPEALSEGLQEIASMAADFTGLSGGPTPLMREIDRLLDAAPGGAIECSVMLVGSAVEVMGSLTRADGGLLRMLRPLNVGVVEAMRAGALAAAAGHPLEMVEFTFDPASVVCLGVRRTVTVETGPRIVTS